MSSAKNSKNPSQNQNRQPQPPKQPQNKSPWTFGYPQCINKKQSRLVCLHPQCQKYPFFCASCQDQSCQNQHNHKDKISSIGFKQLIKRLVTQRKPNPQLEDSINTYKKTLQQLQKYVNEFVISQTKSMDQIIKKQTEYEPEDQKVVAKLKEKKYPEIKGKELDAVWTKVAPTQLKKKLQKQMLQFINSKKEQCQQMTNYFRDGLKLQEKPQNAGSKAK